MMEGPVFRSNVTPDVALSDGNGSDWFVSLVAPAVQLGGVRYAPAGEPIAGLGPLVFYGVLALAGYGLITLTRRGLR
jgi:hypothetical protein